jgi:hypothetical protein
MENQKVYTVEDVINAGCMLEPLKCVKCGYVGEVTYLQYVGDGQCGVCGAWQIGED